MYFILSHCILLLYVHGTIFRNSEEQGVAHVQKAIELKPSIRSASKVQLISGSLNVDRISLATTTWGTCIAASGYSCLSNQTCCGNATTANCYAGTGNVCCNYFYACSSSTPVCCNNNHLGEYYCCGSAYTCGRNATCSISTSPMSSPTNSNSNSGLSPGAIAGIVIGCVIVFGILGKMMDKYEHE